MCVQAANRNGLEAAQCKPQFYRNKELEMSVFFAPAATVSPRAFDSAFERFFRDSSRSVNVEQDDKAWTVTLDMPGVSKENLTIDVEGKFVAIGTKPESKRQFSARYRLPLDIDASATTAELKDGVLTLVLAKQVPVSNARQIEVK
jgi:HSP20 family protein